MPLATLDPLVVAIVCFVMLETEGVVTFVNDLRKADLNVLDRARTIARIAMKVAIVLRENREVNSVRDEVCCSFEDIRAPSMARKAILIRLFLRLESFPVNAQASTQLLQSMTLS